MIRRKDHLRYLIIVVKPCITGLNTAYSISVLHQFPVWKIRQDVVIKTFFTDELWDLRIRYAGEETIKTKYGRLACHKYNPVTVVGRYFRHDDDMDVWFTKDEIPIPVKIRLNLKIGAINGELAAYQKPKNKSLTFSQRNDK